MVAQRGVLRIIKGLKEKPEAFIDEFVKKLKLSPSEMYIFFGRIDGKSLKELGTETGKTKEAIRQAEIRILKRVLPELEPVVSYLLSQYILHKKLAQYKYQLIDMEKLLEVFPLLSRKLLMYVMERILPEKGYVIYPSEKFIIPESSLLTLREIDQIVKKRLKGFYLPATADEMMEFLKKEGVSPDYERRIPVVVQPEEKKLWKFSEEAIDVLRWYGKDIDRDTEFIYYLSGLEKAYNFLLYVRGIRKRENKEVILLTEAVDIFERFVGIRSSFRSYKSMLQQVLIPKYIVVKTNNEIMLTEDLIANISTRELKRLRDFVYKYMKSHKIESLSMEQLKETEEFKKEFPDLNLTSRELKALLTLDPRFEKGKKFNVELRM